MQGTVPWYRQKWVRVVGIVAAAMLAVSAIAAAALFIVIRNSPQKVIADAIAYSLDSPGTYTIKSATLDGRLWLKNGQYRLAATYEGIPVDSISNANMLYLKTSEPQKLFDKFAATGSFGALRPMVEEAVGAVRDKWLAVNLQTKSVSLPVLDQAQCAIEAKQQLANTKTRGEMASLFMQEGFIVIDSLSDTSGSVQYRLSLAADSARTETFMREVRQSHFYRSLDACQGWSDTSLDHLRSIAAEVTINKPMRQMTKLVLKNSGKQVAQVTADYQTDFTIDIPQSTIDADQLVGGIFSSLLRSYLQRR